MALHPNQETLTAEALRRLRLRHLELLDHLGRVATVRAAAELLSLSQPAATKMLQEIEQVFRTPLFMRGRRGIVPNAQGQLLIRHAGLLVQQLNAATRQLEVMRQGASALLNLGATSAMSLLARAIVHLRVQMPQLLVRITDETPARLIGHLLDGHLDCVLAPLHPQAFAQPQIESLQIEPVAPDRLCVVASPHHRLAKARRIAWGDLLDEPWVLSPPEALTRQRFTEVWLARGQVPPKPAIECVSFASVRWLVRFDASVLALMRHHQAREEAALGLIRILPVEPEIPMPDVSFITRRDGAADPASLSALLAAIRHTLDAEHAAPPRGPASGRGHQDSSLQISW